MDKSSELPKPAPGVAFHLEGDGHWDVQKIPDDVFKTLEFSGELSIRGFRCSVFETPDGDQWAQKVPGTPAPKGDEAAMDATASIQRMARNIVARKGIDPNIARAAKAMLEEIRAAEAAMDKARQFGRVLGNEQSLEWIVDQVEAAHDSLKGVVKGIEESLSYAVSD